MAEKRSLLRAYRIIVLSEDISDELYRTISVRPTILDGAIQQILEELDIPLELISFELVLIQVASLLALYPALRRLMTPADAKLLTGVRAMRMPRLEDRVAWRNFINVQ